MAADPRTTWALQVSILELDLIAVLILIMARVIHIGVKLKEHKVLLEGMLQTQTNQLKSCVLKRSFHLEVILMEEGNLSAGQHQTRSIAGHFHNGLAHQTLRVEIDCLAL